MLTEFIPTGGNHEVRIGATTVRKLFPVNFEAELTKHRQLDEIARQGSFRVPAILYADPDKTEIVFERVCDAIDGRTLFIENCRMGGPSFGSGTDNPALRFFSACGRALARIHSHEKPEGAALWQAPGVSAAAFHHFLPASVMQDEREAVFLHGDFGFSNLLCKPENPDQVWVIDPSPNYYILDTCDQPGHRLLDAAKMTLCLRGTVPLKKSLTLRRSAIARVRQAFIESYQTATGVMIDPKLLLRFEMAVFAAKTKYGNYRRWRSLAMAIYLFGLTGGVMAWKGIYAK
jgi:hypothetical protein